MSRVSEVQPKNAKERRGSAAVRTVLGRRQCPGPGRVHAQPRLGAQHPQQPDQAAGERHPQHQTHPSQGQGAPLHPQERGDFF